MNWDKFLGFFFGYPPYFLDENLYQYNTVRYTAVQCWVPCRNDLFSAPAPTLSILSATAPATAIHCHLKLFYNGSIILIEVEISFSSS